MNNDFSNLDVVPLAVVVFLDIEEMKGDANTSRLLVDKDVDSTVIVVVVLVRKVWRCEDAMIVLKSVVFTQRYQNCKRD